jgi:hypothetical protein
VIPLFTNLWHDLLYHEEKAKLYLRGFLLWAGTLAGAITLPGSEWRSWSLGEWVMRLGVAGIVGGAGLVGVGQPNPKAQP